VGALSHKLQRTQLSYKNNRINFNCAKNILEENKKLGNFENRRITLVNT